MLSKYKQASRTHTHTHTLALVAVAARIQIAGLYNVASSHSTSSLRTHVALRCCMQRLSAQQKQTGKPLHTYNHK